MAANTIIQKLNKSAYELKMVLHLRCYLKICFYTYFMKIKFYLFALSIMINKYFFDIFSLLIKFY